jgi:hypothetical protein
METKKLYKDIQNQVNYVNSLSEEERKSLNWYTGGGYDQFNLSIRSNKPLTPILENHKKYIQKAFEHVKPIDNPLTVFKGIDTDIIFSDKSYVSTTIDYKKTYRFTGNNCCILQITVVPGSRILPLYLVSREPDEEEILLEADGTMVVTGTKLNKDNMKIIFVTYSPPKTYKIQQEKELQTAEKKFDREIIIDRIIDILKDEDPDFLEEKTIELIYKQVTNQTIDPKNLETIKKRLNITI